MMQLAAKYLAPPLRGVEIGASAMNPFPGIAAWNVDLPGPSLFRHAQETIAGSVARIDVGASADRLPFPDAALDYVLASHVVEHLPDPISALGEWDRVVKPGGTIFLIVPHPERTWDAGRPLTPIRHLLADFALRRTVRSDPLVPSSHYHVWVTDGFVELIRFLDAAGFLAWDVSETEDVDSKNGHGFTVVARKRAGPRRAGLDAAAAPAFFFMELLLPFQVVRRAVQIVVPGKEFAVPDGAPRGMYRVHPVSGGFPPVAGAPFIVAAGSPVPPPEIHSVSIEGTTSLARGRNLTETTWIEVEAPDGRVHRIFPEPRGDALALDITGMELPKVPIWVTPHNLPPGGGAGPRFHLVPGGSGAATQS